MVSMGAMGDSYYEYLLKVWIYKGRRKEDDMYRGKSPLLEPAICELAGLYMRNKDKPRCCAYCIVGLRRMVLTMAYITLTLHSIGWCEVACRQGG